MNKKRNFIKKIWLKIKNTNFYKVYKEEMVAIPILLFMFYAFNNLFIGLFPSGAFYDFPSQIETIIYKIALFVVTLFVAHMSLSIAFPKVHKFLNDEIYHSFDKIDKDKARTYAVAFILTFIIAFSLIISS